MSADIRNGYDFARALIVANDKMQFPGVDDIEEHAQEDDGAHVVMVHLDNGERLLVTVATLPREPAE